MRALLVAWCLAATAAAQEAPAPEPKSYDLHFQATVVDQGNSRFHAPYSGKNSFLPNPESAASVTSTLFLGWRPLHGTEIYVNPELSGGQGLSSAFGIAGFSNGETYRVGSPIPVIHTSRLYAQQIFGFGQGTEAVAEGLNQIAGMIPERRLIVRVGKFGVMDWFDNNAYSHDPRTQFLNWALANSAAWDYPADTYGYTWGLMSEYHAPSWAMRAAAVAEPKQANQADMDRRIGRAHGFAWEGERRISLGEHKGTARFLVFFNEARMGSYSQTLNTPAFNMDVTQSRAYGRSKYGFTSSDELELAEHLGGFMRLSLSDGRNETWAYTEVDRSLALGLDWNPVRLGRPKDHWGVAQVVNGLSGLHRNYLAGGGYGFIIGDGALHYGPEMITETYYKFMVNDFLAISPDGQFVINPAYNRSRGPVPIWGVRVHAEF